MKYNLFSLNWYYTKNNIDYISWKENNLKIDWRRQNDSKRIYKDKSIFQDKNSTFLLNKLFNSRNYVCVLKFLRNIVGYTDKFHIWNCLNKI